MSSRPEVKPLLLLLQQPRAISSSNITQLPTHDWGIFGEYEYLGPGTPYQKKIEAGIRPRNRIDRHSQFHDQIYSWTNKHQIPGGRLITSGIRGVGDYGAGAAMVMDAFNPWSGLEVDARILGFVAGELLMMQGLLRLNPATMFPMAVVDWLFY